MVWKLFKKLEKFIKILMIRWSMCPTRRTTQKKIWSNINYMALPILFKNLLINNNLMILSMTFFSKIENL